MNSILEQISNQIDRCKALIAYYKSLPNKIGIYWSEPIERAVKKAENALKDGIDLMNIYQELKTYN